MANRGNFERGRKLGAKSFKTTSKPKRSIIKGKNDSYWNVYSPNSNLSFVKKSSVPSVKRPKVGRTYLQPKDKLFLPPKKISKQPTKSNKRKTTKKVNNRVNVNLPQYFGGGGLSMAMQLGEGANQLGHTIGSAIVGDNDRAQAQLDASSKFSSLGLLGLPFGLLAGKKAGEQYDEQQAIEQRNKVRSASQMNFANLMSGPASLKKGGFIEYDGQSHQGPQGGIPVDAMGNPGGSPIALTEDGEVAYFDKNNPQPYVFSNTLKTEDGKTFSEKAKKIKNNYKLRLGKDLNKLDPISNRGLEMEMGKLIQKQEALRMEDSDISIQKEDGGPLNNGDIETSMLALGPGTFIDFPNLATAGRPVSPKNIDQVWNSYGHYVNSLTRQPDVEPQQIKGFHVGIKDKEGQFYYLPKKDYERLYTDEIGSPTNTYKCGGRLKKMKTGGKVPPFGSTFLSNALYNAVSNGGQYDQASFNTPNVSFNNDKWNKVKQFMSGDQPKGGTSWSKSPIEDVNINDIPVDAVTGAATSNPIYDDYAIKPSLRNPNLLDIANEGYSDMSINNPIPGNVITEGNISQNTAGTRPSTTRTSTPVVGNIVPNIDSNDINRPGLDQSLGITNDTIPTNVSTNLNFSGMGLNTDSGVPYDSFKENLPYIAGQVGVGMLGNLAGLLRDQPTYESYSPSRIAPERVSYAPERISARNQARTSSRALARRARNIGLSRNAAISQIGAGTAGINRTLGDIQGRSFQNEANMNAQNRLRANMFNAQAANQAGLRNAYLNYMSNRDAYNNTGQYLSGMTNALQGGLSDIQKSISDRDFLNVLGGRTGYRPVKTKKGIELKPLKNYWE